MEKKISAMDELQRQECLGDFARLRVGQGMDVHVFAPERKLILGGVDIPHEQGLLGHSDADVLAHAVADALLGAVAQKVRDEGFEIIDVDSVIAAQRPKLSPYRDQMRANLAQAMGIPVENVGVKATTTEHLGFEGREEGISATCSCLVCRCTQA